MNSSKKLNKEQALHKAAVLCAQKECCPADIKEKLGRWRIENDDQEHIIEYLIEQQYINIDRFTHSFIKDKFRFEGWGKEKIKYHLKQKKIPSTTLHEAFMEIDQDEYETKLLQLLRQKHRQTKVCSQLELEGKLYRFAISRGFESELIFKTLKIIDRANEQENEE